MGAQCLWLTPVGAALWSKRLLATPPRAVVCRQRQGHLIRAELGACEHHGERPVRPEGAPVSRRGVGPRGPRSGARMGRLRCTPCGRGTPIARSCRPHARPQHGRSSWAAMRDSGSRRGAGSGVSKAHLRELAGSGKSQRRTRRENREAPSSLLVTGDPRPSPPAKPRADTTHIFPRKSPRFGLDGTWCHRRGKAMLRRGQTTLKVNCTGKGNGTTKAQQWPCGGRSKGRAGEPWARPAEQRAPEGGREDATAASRGGAPP